MIKNYETGFIDTDIDYLIQKMELLLLNRSRAAEIGANGKKYAEDRFNIERFTKEWEKTFELAIVKNKIMKKQIAFISEHASPLATLGGVDSGGQNVYVAELPKQLVKLGYNVDIYTRKEDETIDEIINWLPGIRVIHVKAGRKK